MAIAREHDYQTQVDRACAAQSPDMLPKDKPVLTKEQNLQHIHTTVNRYFNGV